MNFCLSDKLLSIRNTQSCKLSNMILTHHNSVCMNDEKVVLFNITMILLKTIKYFRVVPYTSRLCGIIRIVLH